MTTLHASSNTNLKYVTGINHGVDQAEAYIPKHQLEI